MTSHIHQSWRKFQSVL